MSGRRSEAKIRKPGDLPFQRRDSAERGILQGGFPLADAIKRADVDRLPGLFAAFSGHIPRLSPNNHGGHPDRFAPRDAMPSIHVLPTP